MRTGPGEQPASAWRAVQLTDLATLILDSAEETPPRSPRIVAVDGRSGGGKSTLAQRLADAVSYRPPAWDLHDRPGAIAVPAGRRLVIVEGVGAGRRELSGLIDFLVWVQSDYAEAERLGIARDVASGVNGGPQATIDFWHAWMADEVPFLQADRPWDRADLIAAGTSTDPRPSDQVLIASSDG